MRALLITSALIISACQTASPALEAELSEEWGSATRHNIQAHAVVPTAEQKNRTFIPADRTRRALAIQTYRDGEVADVENQSTQGN